MRTIDTIRPVSIQSVVQESSNVRSLYFEDQASLNAEPGCFVMVWLPGAGEFPMSVSLSKGKLASIGVKAMGEGSRRLYESKAGTRLGIRGPYGIPFQLKQARGRKRVLLVGGGTGLVPMIVLAKAFSKQKTKIKVSVVVAARTRDELPFLRAFSLFLGKENVFATTDDGSCGFHGLGHEKVEELVREGKRIDQIYSCGPERMLAQIYRIAKKESIPVQFSLERIMKCGIGICGSCTIADRVLCRDGPVFSSADLDRLSEEFGKSGRDKTGMLVHL